MNEYIGYQIVDDMWYKKRKHIYHLMGIYDGGHYDTFDTVCHNIVTRPTLSWQYVEELTNEQIYNTVIFN